MLLQFYFSNFRSFEEESVLDMRASRISEYPGHVCDIGNDHVLPVAAIYGANASGKSNVYEAFDFMRQYVMYSFMLEEHDESSDADIPPWIKNLKPTPFLLSESRDKPSEFDVFFVQPKNGKDTYYHYGFSIDKMGVCEEWLEVNTKTGVRQKKAYKIVFQRDRKKGITYSDSLKGYKENLELSLNDKTLIVSLGSKLKIEEMKYIEQWFIDLECLNLSNFAVDSVVLHRLPYGIIQNLAVKKQVLDFLHSFDDSIFDLAFKEIPSSDKKKKYNVFSVHHSEKGGSREFPLEAESAGTIKMFSLYNSFIRVLRNGGILFADELDIKLHPLLMRNIIIAFTDPEKNPHHAQLIFTTHNVTYLEMGIFRRDEIWFTKKNEERSELYSLDDIEDKKGNKVRKDSDYAKNYLLGSYGAIPQLFDLGGAGTDE